MKQGKSLRAKGYRVQYDPEWSLSAPYKLYRNGEAILNFGSFAAVICCTGIAREFWV